MSGSTAAPAVYARALFEAAGGNAVAVRDQLEPLAEQAAAGTDDWQALVSPTVPLPAAQATVKQLLEGALPVAVNFLLLLIDNGRLDELADVYDVYVELVKVQQGELDVRITTAIELPAELRSKLEQRLGSSTGQTVRLHTSVDPSIIGGLVVQHGDSLVDTSLRSRLDQLRLALQRPGAGNSPSSSSTQNDD